LSKRKRRGAKPQKDDEAVCFYNDDYDWCPTIYEESEGPVKSTVRCSECNKKILEGQWAKQIYMQEYEECQLCEEMDESCEHDYGNTYDYYGCERCERLREALRLVEEAEGCSGNEAEPGRGTMFTDVGDGEGWDHYAFQHAKLFPGEYIPWPVYWDSEVDKLANEYENFHCYSNCRPEEVVLGGEG
jgi:hypothetical protein